MDYLLIFFAKIIEVSMMTVRTVLLAKGQKMFASIIGFFENLIWLAVISVVLVGITEDPLKMFTYALGFSVGCYVGSIIESRLALGLITIQVIVESSEGKVLTNLLRNQNIAVTVIEGEGRDTNKDILILYVKRKEKNKVVKYIEEHVEKTVITVSDVQVVHGGYGLLRK